MAKITVTDISISGHSKLHLEEPDIACFPRHVKCPACSSGESTSEVVQLGRASWKVRLSLVACDNCGTVFYENPPPEEYIQNYYRKHWNYEKEKSLTYGATKITPKTKALSLVDDLFGRATSIRILDYGCGHGGSLLGLKNAGFTDLHGIELSEVRSKVANEFLGGNVIFGDYLSISKSEKFDVIYSNHVLEHTYIPHAVVEGLLDRLTDSGKLVIFVPDSRYELVVTQTLFLPHLFSFTHKCFERLGEKFDLDVSFWNGARRDEICAVLSRRGSTGPRRPDNFFKFSPLLDVSSQSQVERIRELWNIAIRPSGVYIACNSAVHNLKSKSQMKNGFALINRRIAFLLKIGEALQFLFKRLRLHRLSNLTCLIYTKSSRKHHELVGWRHIHAQGVGDVRDIPIIESVDGRVCLTIK